MTSRAAAREAARLYVDGHDARNTPEGKLTPRERRRAIRKTARIFRKHNVGVWLPDDQGQS